MIVTQREGLGRLRQLSLGKLPPIKDEGQTDRVTTHVYAIWNPPTMTSRSKPTTTTTTTISTYRTPLKLTDNPDFHFFGKLRSWFIHVQKINIESQSVQRTE